MTVRALVALVALGCCSGPAWAADGEGLSGYSLTSWHAGNGRPLGSVYTIVQERDGYLWIGADAGLFRFDGWQLTDWNALSDAALPASAVTALCVTRGGNIWAGLDGAGIHQIRKGAIQFESSRENGPNSVRQIVEDLDGTLWAVGDGALYQRREKSWERVDLPLQRGVASPLSNIAGGVLQLYVGRQGDLWVGTRWGVLHRGRRSEHFDKLSEDPAWGITEDSAGRVWTSDVLSGFRRLGSTDLPQHEFQGTGYRLLHDRSGHLWVATFGKGLWLVSGDPGGHAFTVERAGVATGLSTNSTLALLEDDEGNIWVGTTAGLHRLTPRELTPVEGLRDILVLEAARGGSLWAGTPDGLVQLGRRTPPYQEIGIGLRGHDVRALYDDGNATLWIGTTAGLWRLSGRRLSSVEIPGRPDMPVFSIAPDPNGGVWLGDGVGLFRWNGSDLVPLQRESAEAGRIALARTDSSGRLWVGFLDGRIGVRERDGTLRMVAEHDGLNARTHDAIYTIFEGPDGVLWFGGSGGLTALSGGRFRTVGREQGLPDGGVRAIAEDDDGYLWLNMEHGLLRMPRDEFAKAAANPSYRVRYRLYDALDGVAGPPIGLFGSARADDRTLWFIRGGGLTLVDLTRLKRELTAVSTIRVESVLADERRLPPMPRMAIAPGTRRIEINYTALALTASHKVGFRYWLEGVDPDWVDAGTRRSVSYTNLAPGDYRFRVEAMAADGRRDASQTAWEFTVQPAYYQTTWFYALCICIAVAATWSAWRLRVAFIRQQFSLALAERARLSRELHDTLLQSLVGVTLQLRAVADADGSDRSWTRDQLTRIRRHVEAYIGEAEQSIRDLRSPSLVKKDLVTALNEFGAETVAPYATRFEPAATSPLPQYSAKVEAQLLRIGQEAITNAVRHANAGRIWLDVRSDGHLMTLRVSDNGCGFDAENPPADTRHHFGLLTMKERAEELGGRLAIASSPTGTTVEAVVPLSIRDRLLVEA